MVKHTQTIRRLLPTICLTVFHHFVELALKALTIFRPVLHFYTSGFLAFSGGIDKELLPDIGLLNLKDNLFPITGFPIKWLKFETC